ncbi:MAG: ATP-dependent Clp protease ATP-binding subunit ClpA, partial [Spirochaetaceae bacterium]|nr:ATP-dependent Clp protease ATP-binding subunit ClpA [Spirochaetaceae bacterium]
DAVIPFEHLSKEIMVSIVHKEVEKLSQRLADKGVKISVTDKCAEYLAEEGYSIEFGARNISRIIDEKISSKLVDEVLFGCLSEGGTVCCDLKNGEITLKYGRKSKRQ